MASSNSWARYVFGYAFAGASWSTQSTWVSLHNGDPSTTGANELSNNTYARRATGAFAAISTATSVTTNTSVITFPTDGNGESVAYAGLWYGSSTGTFLFGGALTSSFAYNNGVTPVFAAGALKLRAT
jgi:hypothetical protein